MGEKCRSTQHFPLDRFSLNLQFPSAHWQKPLMVFCVKRQDDFFLFSLVQKWLEMKVGLPFSVSTRMIDCHYEKVKKKSLRNIIGEC